MTSESNPVNNGNGNYTYYEGYSAPDETFKLSIIHLIFINCTQIKEFNGDSVSMESSAFEDCENLAAVNINASKLELDYNCFQNCLSQLSIILCASDIYIIHDCFGNCPKMTDFTIISHITKIAGPIFSECYKLENITIISNSLHITGDMSDVGIPNLANIYIKANNITGNGMNAFNFFEHLQTIYIESKYHIRNLGFYNCKISKSFCIVCNSFEALTIRNCDIYDIDIKLQNNTNPDAEKIVNYCRISNSFKLTGNLTKFNNNYIGKYIKTFIINNTDDENILTIVGNRNNELEGTDYNVYSKKLVLGSGVFDNTILHSVYIECDQFNTDLQNRPDDELYQTNTGYIFYGSRDLNSITINAKDVFIGRAFMFETVVTKFYLECETLSFINSDKVNQEDNFYFYDSKAVFINCDALENVTLKCKNLNETNIHFDENCPNLNTISITMNEIVDQNGFRFVFNDLEGLKSFHLNYAKQISLNKQAFQHCASLCDLKLPNDVMLSQYAFDGCSSLQQFLISRINHEIPRNTFSGCKSITSLNLENNIEIIYEQAFQNTGIINLVIPNSIKEIHTGAFNDCSIESLTIPADFTTKLTTAKNDPRFANCIHLTKITIKGNIHNLSAQEFHEIPKQITIYFYGDEDLSDTETNPFPDVAIKVCATSRYSKTTYAKVPVASECRMKVSDEKTLLVEYQNEFIKIILSLIPYLLQ